MRVVLITQARMTSTRLPGKVLKEVLGKPLLEYHVERLRQARNADEVVVATTKNDTDEPIVELCGKLGVTCFRGSEEDVLSRYYGAAVEHSAEVIVRVTSDCPLIDPAVIDRVISTFQDRLPEVDYVANTLERTFPRGMDTEVLTFGALDEAHREATETPDREHVTRFIYMHPERYRMENVALESDLSSHRWTVDTPEDFKLIRLLIEALYVARPRFTLEDCLEVSLRHPEWAKINRQVNQKTK